MGREDTVILVDDNDRPVGVAEKIAAHRGPGQLHRAFSIFIFHSDGRLLLQRRALTKHHFRGLWSNTCCGHPRKEENVLAAAARRLQEELGFQTPLQEAASFVYSATDPESALTEHEYDHVLVGHYDCDPCPDPLEVTEWKWAHMPALQQDLMQNPARYTPWFAPALQALLAANRAEVFVDDVGP